jgi:hypothetical protein
MTSVETFDDKKKALAASRGSLKAEKIILYITRFAAVPPHNVIGLLDKMRAAPGPVSPSSLSPRRTLQKQGANANEGQELIWRYSTGEYAPPCAFRDVVGAEALLEEDPRLSWSLNPPRTPLR